ncbi:MAG: ABC transporter substrate-binding protein [Thermosediminibacteraceae bacterium]|nr:ABC transporter substrate-binding protein [Thermosediminibacteraceae bacterium]
MKRKLLCLTLISILILSLVAGCSSKSQNTVGDAQPQEQKTEKVTLKLGIWSSSPAEKKIVEDQIAAFKEKYPNIDVQIETIVGDYMQQMQTRIASKTAPDIFYLDSMPAPQLMSSGVLEPLDEYIQKYNVDIEDFEPALLEAFKWEGKIYGLPKDFNTLVLFYNKDMFEKAGLSEPPKTWEELREYAKKLTKDNVKGIVLNNELARYQAFVNQNGGSVFKDGKPTLDLPENIEALQFYTDLILKDKVADTPQNLGVGWNGDAFAEGKAAMAIEGGWMIPFLKEKAPDLKYGMAELPAGKQKATMAFTVAYVLSKDSKHKEEAFQLLNFLTSQEGQKYVVESGLALPSRKSMMAKFKKTYPERAPFVDSASYAVPFQYGLIGQKLVDEANKACEAVIMKQVKSAKEALENAQKALQQ